MINSYSIDIEYHILKHLQQAENKLLIAVAWFTNNRLGNEILQLKNVETEIVVDDNTVNRKSSILRELENKNISITYVKDKEKQHYLMHNKFCVIDDKFVITGSYNWTENAKTNDENITVLINKSTIIYYSAEFRRLVQIANPVKLSSMTEDEINDSIKLIYTGLKSYLKSNFNNLEQGSIIDWNDSKIIRDIYYKQEKVNVSIKMQVGNFWPYRHLRNKYGSGFMELASEAEKAESRDNYLKKDLEYFPEVIYGVFQTLKLRAIQLLIDNYIELMRTKINNETEVLRIQKVILFLSNEKRELHSTLYESY